MKRHNIEAGGRVVGFSKSAFYILGTVISLDIVNPPYFDFVKYYLLLKSMSLFNFYGRSSLTRY